MLGGVTPEALVSSLAGAALLAWLYLVAFHGRFWMGDQRLGGDVGDPAVWPAVTAVVPARNEADVIETTACAVVAQEYPGPFHVVVVDDESDDATDEASRAGARRAGLGERLTVLRTKPRPEGWVGKTWALHTGVEHALDAFPETDYFWLNDADVAPSARTLRRLVAKAAAERLDLVSLMVRLHCERGWERLLVPAFVYFFQKLYPFKRVNDPNARTAGAAGGCIVVRADALARAGGIAAICGELIDDCALAARIKRGGALWLGLAQEENSLRPYPRLSDIWEMVARSAYTQLRHSPLLLAGTLAGLLLLYAVPVAALLGWPLHGSAVAGLCGACAWLAMSISFLPTLVLYRRTPLLAPALPVAGLLYGAMTFDSALRHRRGCGARWKGRTFRAAGPPKDQTPRALSRT
jgi:hopene-associated glycosyltransferase HpnB